MTKIEQLRKYYGLSMAADPQVVELCDLVEMQNAALKNYTDVCSSYNAQNDFAPKIIDAGGSARNAITSFKEWNKP